MATVVYLALAGTVLTFGLYYWLLRHFASHRLSLIAYTAPIIALLLSWITGESEPHLHTVLGSGLILVGVAVATRRPR
jgi:drug/metabolite transporter (DMT)-like permease